ncbi:MAG: hypothetical protein IPM38_13640 [Ignavibacteria bacterium]|nr:hypothetical protein [Ignavibacteria bacterium]
MKTLNKVISVFCIMIMFGLTSDISAQDKGAVYGVSTLGDNSKIVDVDIPESLNPGEEYPASITFINTGKNIWDKDDNYLLSLYDQSDNVYKSDVWGIKNVNIPNNVIPGEKAIVIFKIKAPYEPGVYNSKWAMTKDNNYFGEYSINVTKVNGEAVPVVYSVEGNESRFISVSIPENMNAGEKYKVSVSIENTGMYPWNSSEGYTLAPVQQSAAKVYADWNSTPVALSSTIESGQTSSIEFYVTAPPSAGFYEMQWMMKKGDSYFGQASDKVTVNVSGIIAIKELPPGTNNSSYIKQQIPNSVSFNEELDVFVTMANTGNTAWIKGNEQLVVVDKDLKIQSINPWGIGYIQLPENIPPGKLVTFNFKVKPNEIGLQHFQMMMMDKDGNLFGGPSKSVQVIVKN